MNKRPGEVLLDFMNAKGISQNELARRSGVTQPTISRIISGKHGDPDVPTLEKLAACFDLTAGDFLGYAVSEPDGVYSLSSGGVGSEDHGRVPRVSWATAAQWERVDQRGDHIEGWERTTGPVAIRAFALTVKDDSMEPQFAIGDTIIVDPEREADHFNYVVVRFANDPEATFKQLIKDGGRRYLKPLNHRYPVVELTPDGTIIGVIVAKSKTY